MKEKINIKNKRQQRKSTSQWRLIHLHIYAHFSGTLIRLFGYAGWSFLTQGTCPYVYIFSNCDSNQWSNNCFHDISSNYISSIRHFFKCDILSIQRLVAYDIWLNTTFHLNFVALSNWSKFSRKGQHHDNSFYHTFTRKYVHFAYVVLIWLNMVERKRCDNGSRGWYSFFAWAKKKTHIPGHMGDWLFCLSKNPYHHSWSTQQSCLWLRIWYQIGKRQKEKCMILNRLW